MITTINDFKRISENINYQPEDVIELKGYNFTDIFNLVNKECFDNKLTIIPFELSNTKSYTASFNYIINKRTREITDQKFKFSTLFKITFQKLKNIMAHEMIHYYLRSINDKEKSAHGYSFKREMNRINNLGLGYKISIHDDEPGELHNDVISKKTPQKIFVTFETKSKRGYALFPKNSYSKQDLMKMVNLYGYKNVNVYSTTSPHTKPLKTSSYQYFTINAQYEHLLDNVFNDFENTHFLYSIEN